GKSFHDPIHRGSALLADLRSLQLVKIFTAELARRRKHELCTDEVHADVVARIELALEDALTQAVLNLALHGATQRTCTERRVEPDLDEPLLGRLCEVDGEVAVQHPLGEALREEPHALQELRLAELREHDGLIDT